MNNKLFDIIKYDTSYSQKFISLFLDFVHERKSPEFKMKKEEEIKRNIQSKILNGNKKIILLSHGGNEIAGFVVYSFRDNEAIYYEIPPSICTIDFLYIASPFRGKGGAHIMKNAVLRDCVKNQITIVRLHVASDNTAKEVYKSWGFEEYKVLMQKKINMSSL